MRLLGTGYFWAFCALIGVMIGRLLTVADFASFVLLCVFFVIAVLTYFELAG